MSKDAIISAFELQATWCDEMGSPFTAALMRRAAENIRGGGIVDKLIGDWPGHPLADALMMRFAGLLHAAALWRKDERLAALYPDFNPNWRIEEIWPVALAFLEREETWARQFLKSPPQTNETRRTIAMLPAFLSLAKHGPLHLRELGASAGLNLNWEKFRYETDSWSWGPKGGPHMDTEWRGAAPADLDARVVIASCEACDRNPLDARNPDHVMRLRAYVWADQPERRTRLDAALALAQETGVHPEKADAGDWLTRKLDAPLPEGVTLIYHSVAWQYFSPETRERATAAIEGAAARADTKHRIAWLRYEAGRIIGMEGPVDQMGVDLAVWPGGARRILARTDGHARWVELLQ